MQITIERFTVTKLSPLTISRGTNRGNTNLWVRVVADGLEGWGEASPLVHGVHHQTTEALETALQAIAPVLADAHPLDRQRIEQAIRTLPSAARAAIDLALWDWLGKRSGLALWQLWGADRDRIPPISVTIGIGSPEAARQRVQQWREVIDTPWLKLKLGSPEGLAADRALVEAVQDEAPQARLLVDANGGWDLTGAIAMADWLAERGVAYLEQPLPVGCEAQLADLKARSPLPIFVDESCFDSHDLPRLAPWVDGINLKLMKCGGLSEAARMVATARACGLQVMLGCYSDSALANTAALHLGAWADYLDLDSHLNLIDDPFTGAAIAPGGRLLPSDRPGLGVDRRSP